MTLLPEHPPPEPYHYVHGENAGSQDDDDQDPSSDENDEDGDEDGILATLQAATSSESEPEGEDGDGLGRGEPKQTRKKRSPDLNKYRSVTTTIAVLMLACWTMRVPVMFRDFIRSVSSLATWVSLILRRLQRHRSIRSAVFRSSSAFASDNGGSFDESQDPIIVDAGEYSLEPVILVY